METPTQRMLKIGRTSIGLIGLDIALNRALAQNIPVEDISEHLYQEIRDKNYIPPGMTDKYKTALEREYRILLGLEIEENKDLTIRIFGTGCITCNGLRDAVIDAMMKMGIAADIDMVHEPDEIGRYGITTTPALMINGEIKSAGIHPTPFQLEEWFREAVDN